MTIWIAGRGIVGRRLTRLLEAAEPRFFDPRFDSLSVGAGDVAILCHPDRHAPLAEAIGARGASVVTVGDDFDDAQDLLPLGAAFASRATTLVVGAARSPGLSGLLARHLAPQLASVDEIHVAIHGTAGPACARSYHRSLSRRSLAWHDGAWADYLGGSGRELCWFPEPVGALDCYRADTADPLLLHAAFPEVDRISARRSARRRDRFTARLPMMSPPHQEGGVGALRVEVRGSNADGGRECLIVGVAELVGTAAAATAAAFATLVAEGRLASGLVVAGQEEVPTLDALERIESYGVRLQEFTGVPQRT
jgi:saccharopine dehydrogenase-like NADP-dependent oxidoreductase